MGIGMRWLAPAALIGALSGTLAQAGEPLVISVKRLSTDVAVKVAQGALDACRKKGIQVAATVVDREGVVQVQLRDTIAAPITVTISRMKAFTAVNFAAATSSLARRADTPVGRVQGLVMSPGGVPIEVGGSLLGAVGVSGAPPGETDEACAKAGIAKVQDELELGM
jgi:uncharacterized protein GlcG (DUF336 family)